MTTPASLLEFLRRTHLGTAQLHAHCRQLSAEELHRELPGFGYPTVQLQLHHISGAEDYWIDVLSGRPYRGEEPAAYPDIDALEAYRQATLAATAAYLETQDETGLGTPQEFVLWNGDRAVLLPEMVLMRLVTHPFHHRGQVLAMCRHLGYPLPHGSGMDFPIRPA
jgi:uncharacterized damage-inducible protein DinB